jgi:hypothetical protein
MIVFSISMPGRFGDWCEAAIERLASLVLGPVVSMQADTAEELASVLIKTEAPHFYSRARQPNRWLRDNLTAANKPFVVAIDHPHYAVNDLMTRHNLEPADATRRVASSCATLSRYTSLPGALVITAERDWVDPIATIAAIGNHLGLEVSPSTVEQIAVDLAAAGLQPSTASDTSWPAHLTEDDAAMIGGAVGVYSQYLGSGLLDQITWSRQLFHGDGQSVLSRVIDITGKPRCLAYGPYIALPWGDWTADLVLGFSEDATEATFKIDIFAGSILNVTSIKPTQAGVQTISINFVIEEANDNLVEIRLYSETAAIFGEIALGHAILTRRRGVSTEISSSLRSDLGLPVQ